MVFEKFKMLNSTDLWTSLDRKFSRKSSKSSTEKRSWGTFSFENIIEFTQFLANVLLTIIWLTKKNFIWNTIVAPGLAFTIKSKAFLKGERRFGVLRKLLQTFSFKTGVARTEKLVFWGRFVKLVRKTRMRKKDLFCWKFFELFSAYLINSNLTRTVPIFILTMLILNYKPIVVNFTLSVSTASGHQISNFKVVVSEMSLINSKSLFGIYV